MEKTLQEWNKSKRKEDKPIYDSLKNKLEETMKKMETMTAERQTILENYLVLKEALDATEGQKGELERENLDMKSRIRELEVEASCLTAEILRSKGEVRTLVDKVNSLSEENKRLSQKFAENEKKCEAETKELNEKKLEMDQAEDQDLIILGDFIYQFHTLLAKVFGEKNGIGIAQVEEMIQQNHSPQGVEAFKRLGLAEEEVLEKLDKSLRVIKDATNFVGRRTIKTSIKLSFKDIEEIAKKHFLYTRVVPIISAWKLLMKSGEIFDASTWVLNITS